MKVGANRYRYLLAALLLLCLMPFESAAQQRKKEEKDSLLTLLNAEYARVFERAGHREYREIKGPATFLHNGAYVFCDSAIWNLTFNQIEAYDNVKLVQDKTILTSDNMIYYGDDNLARFRGELVQVKDEDGNTLRTRYLDYNTKDSVATFFFGGAMMTGKGEVIEGDRGTYDSKTGVFSFEDNVEMFTDSLFIKTKRLDYNTRENKAYFGKVTHLWKQDAYMNGEYGWYAQDSGIVYFDSRVYANSPDYEVWCDTLYFFQHENRGLMYKDVQLLDSLNNTYFVSDGAEMQTDSIKNLFATLFNDPACVYVGENEQHIVDSLFCRADTMELHTVRVCDVTSDMRSKSDEAKTLVTFDAIGEADRKALEKQETEKNEAIKNLPEYKAYVKRKEIRDKQVKDSLEKAEQLRVQDSLAHLAELDSLAALGITAEDEVQEPDMQQSGQNTSDSLLQDDVAAQQDSLQVQDSLATEIKDTRDTSQLRFLNAYHNVKIFRTDLQMRCDSLYFTQVDSLVRLYQDPVLWNEGVHQISGGSMILRMNKGHFDRANVHENAMILSEEDTVHYDQVKATDMLGYFTEDNKLRRFDALGGVNAMFYLREDSVITVLNSKEAQFMMVTLKDGFAERLKYYETIKSDAFPVYKLPIEKQRLKDFKWRAEEKPENSAAITTRTLRRSRRFGSAVERVPEFKRSNQYFDNYMTDIFKQIEDRKIAAELEQLRRDSIADAQALEVTLAAVDSAMGITREFSDDGDVVIDSLQKPDPVVGMDTITRRDMRLIAHGKKKRDKDEQQNVDQTVSGHKESGKEGLEQQNVSPMMAEQIEHGKEKDVRQNVEPLMADYMESEQKKPERQDVLMPEAMAEMGDKAVDSRTIVVENDIAGEVSEVEIIQTAEDGRKLTRTEKKALKKAARKLRREARKAEKEARKVQKSMRIEKAVKPQKAVKSAK